MDKKQEALRAIPQVDALLESAPVKALLQETSRELLAKAAREVLAQTREDILHDRPVSLSDSDLALAIQQKAQSYRLPGQQPVINASGVLLHTNLGRAPLSRRAGEAAFMAACNYLTLEYDLKTGQRGNRHDHVEGLLCELLHAPAALVVNNNAAAVLLMLTALASGQDVIVSRGQLVEIGGSFRMPDIMRLSGARLVEVGTTNRTRLADYEAAISPETALLLRVHTSNFKIVGFAEEVSIEDLARLGASRGVAVADDVGSGALAGLPALAEEPSVLASVQAGADVVTSSGDKLLGGPQAGLVVGRRTWIEAMKQHPLARAVRVDKLTLAALEATLLLYREPERALASIPTLRFLAREAGESRLLAERLAGLIQQKLAALAERDGGAPDLDRAHLGLAIEEAEARAGGGALPLWTIPSWAVALESGTCGAAELEERLRAAPLPVVSRVAKDRVLLVTAALQPEELEPLAESVAWAARGPGLSEG